MKIKNLLVVCVLLMSAMAMKAADYYLIGTMTGWTKMTDDKYKFVLNDKAEPGIIEYMLTIDLKANDKFKVISDADAWFPDGGEENNYVVTSDGKYDIYFRPDGNGDSSWHKNYIFVGPSSITALGNVAVSAKAVKVVENGRIYIVRNGVRFNIIGAVVE